MYQHLKCFCKIPEVVVRFKSVVDLINYSRWLPWIISLQTSVQLNRKVLSDLAINEPRTFQSLAKLARARQQEGFRAALGSGSEPPGILSRVVLLQWSIAPSCLSCSILSTLMQHTLLLCWAWSEMSPIETHTNRSLLPGCYQESLCLWIELSLTLPALTSDWGAEKIDTV